MPTATGSIEYVPIMREEFMSNGYSTADAHRRCGQIVAKILRGEKPADIPVELPTRYKLTLNLQTAKALGLSFRSRCACEQTR